MDYADTLALGAPAPTVGSVAPANPSTGQLWYDPGTGATKIWTGSTWAYVSAAPGSGTTPGTPGTTTGFAMHYQGTISPLGMPILSAVKGDLYIANGAGTLGPNWGTHGSGAKVKEGDLLLCIGADWIVLDGAGKPHLPLAGGTMDPGADVNFNNGKATNLDLDIGRY